MNPIDLNLEPSILAVSVIIVVSLRRVIYLIIRVFPTSKLSGAKSSTNSGLLALDPALLSAKLPWTGAAMFRAKV